MPAAPTSFVSVHAVGSLDRESPCLGDFLHAIEACAGVAGRLITLDLLLGKPQLLRNGALRQTRHDAPFDQGDRKLEKAVQSARADLAPLQGLIAIQLLGEVGELALETVDHGFVDPLVHAGIGPARLGGLDGRFELADLLLRNEVLLLVGDHVSAPRSMATMPLASPVVLSCWKNSRNRVPAGVAAAFAMNNSPRNFFFCAVRG